jgi:hypothetical protein
LDTLYHDEFTVLDCFNQFIQPFVLVGVQHEEVFSKGTSQPNRSLQLGIDDEGPSGGGGDNRTVFKGHLIGGESFIFPLSHFRLGGQDLKRGDSLSDRDLFV